MAARAANREFTLLPSRLSFIIFYGLLKNVLGPCHSEPVRPPTANGPESHEGAQGKLGEESRIEIEGQGEIPRRLRLLGMTRWAGFLVALRLRSGQALRVLGMTDGTSFFQQPAKR